MHHLPSRIGSFGQFAAGRTQAMDDGGNGQQDASADGRFLLQGYLLKRSETLRRWNKRWFSLDPTTARLEYRSQRSDLYPRGQIVFDASSTITVSPINFNSGAKQYDGCCLYIGTPRKKDYFLAAETPAAARAWVTALRAAMQVLKAHRDAVNALGDSQRRQQSEAALRAAATASNATAEAMAKEIQAASQKLVLQGFGMQAEESGQADEGSDDGVMDGTTIVKETLRVKDEELAQMAQDLRARDSTIREMADRLSETAEAAEAAAAAAMQMDRDRKAAVSEAAQARRLAENALKEAETRIKEAQERAAQKVKTLEADREEAIHRAMQWKAEADRAHEKARALELALRQAQGAAATAKTHGLAADKPPVEPALEPPATTILTSTAEPSQAPAEPDAAAVQSARAGHEVNEAAQQTAADPHSNENGVDLGHNKEPSMDQQSEKEEHKAGPSAPVVGAGPPEQRGPETSNTSNTDGVAGEGVGGDADGAGLQNVSQSGAPPKHEDVESPSVQKSSPAEDQKNVVDKKQPGDAGHTSGFVDDVPAMDPGFLAAFRQGSLGSQPESGKPDDNP
ncbi:hypothetical protein KFL_000710330 [Klebsormidium nitens]|uniref:PH domain-containing protein n=1 Tax=Klebsormidium nitens TaxID=105231 RepID=A0A1Y1HZ36_KLENI|nr:hypothetical protein KFL_000710330 [Klebsormidium nitens]|eukprot:GAQ81128.1 hypothetical protein KFL_000710330 [Klebsormidium nitens]